MKDENLKDIYNSYVARIHDFRREQHNITMILVGLFTLAIKALIDLEKEGKLQDLSGPLFGVVTVASIVLVFLFLNHAYIVLLFSRLLKRLEERMEMPLDLRFYSQFRFGRGASYMLSLSLPFVLYFSMSFFFYTVAKLPPYFYWIGWSAHFVLWFGAYFFILSIRRKAWLAHSDFSEGSR